MNIQLLEKLASFQSLSIAPDIDKVINQLEPCLVNYAELEFRSDGRRIDLITLSDELDAVDEFLAILKDRGISNQELLAIESLSRFGSGCTMGMKLPIAGNIIGGEIYIRAALPLPEIRYFLEQHDIRTPVIAQITTLAEIFEKNYLHILAADAKYPASFSAFLTTYLVSEEEHIDSLRLKRALENIGITEIGIDKFLRLHTLLSGARPETLYFSWNISSEKRAVGAKIDYVGVRLGIVSEIMRTIGSSEQAKIPFMWGRELDTQYTNYMGVLVGEDKLTGIRAYFTQSKV